MLHTKFHGNRPSGCCKKIFEGFFPYKGMAGILVIQDLVKNGPVVSEKSMF